ncbi:hypothetical protein SAMN05661080_01437 [Modestobacter sp. DSM 44400]|uniref:hypothetical protein n=1 Tax=Modestobacter sp. DSM 44400 TaxID=1550230 RepID=UPI00089D5D61|nr:hypothetical protein [Modestobacter sp. DSM 44400]SDX84574.1 hypothetical protein SAMN05661080_01437 [Modestobacter sp. DSM 44400]
MGERRAGLVLSYLALRRSVGVIGLALPLTLAVGGLVVDGSGLHPTISDYYYSGMRDVLVGSLCAMAVFLASYRYDRPDAVAGTVAGLAAVGVALFPSTPAGASGGVDPVGVVHLICAATFFLTLAWFCLALFTRTHPDLPPTARKRQRNAVYRVCGATILISVALAAVTGALPDDGWMAAVHPVFYLESLAVIAFGVAWFVKGETILTD